MRCPDCQVPTQNNTNQTPPAGSPPPYDISNYTVPADCNNTQEDTICCSAGTLRNACYTLSGIN